MEKNSEATISAEDFKAFQEFIKLKNEKKEQDTSEILDADGDVVGSEKSVESALAPDTRTLEEQLEKLQEESEQFKKEFKMESKKEEIDKQRLAVDDEYEKNRDVMENELSRLLGNSVDNSSLAVARADGNHSQRVFNSLSEKRKAQAVELSKQLVQSDTFSVQDFGSEAQQQLGSFSSDLIAKVKSSETGEVGNTLNELSLSLNESDANDFLKKDSMLNKLSFGLINKARRSVYNISAKYDSMGDKVDDISDRLLEDKASLAKDNEVLEVFYSQNKDYFEALNIYIGAGEKRLEELYGTEIPKLLEKVKTENNPMLLQELTDLKDFTNRLEKRVYDLKLSRQITIQQAPQLRLIQNTNLALMENIQTSVNTAIPLWRNQIAVAITIIRQADSVVAQKQVTDTTQRLLLSNAQMLKQSAIETAKENERGIIDIVTLKETQKHLVETISQTVQIQKEGSEQRRLAELELGKLEDSLRIQMIEATQGKTSKSGRININNQSK